MEKATIGAILKNRINEKGYTQEEFAEEVGISYSALKKYMSGKNAYNYEVMELFADKLGCSYDYLLGLSKSPVNEHREIAELTRLSEQAIKKITQYARHYDDDFEARRYISCLDILLCDDDFFNWLFDFMITSKPMEKMYEGLIGLFQGQIDNNPRLKELDIKEERKVTMEMYLLMTIVTKLKDIKYKVTPELIAEMREFEVEEKYQSAMEFLTVFFSSLKNNES